MPAKSARSGGFEFVQKLENRLFFSRFSPISAPVGLTAVARSSTTVILSWNADNTIGETGIRVERSTNNATWVTAVVAPPDSQGWLDTNLSPNTSYFYRIAAFNSSGTFYSGSQADVHTPANTFAVLDTDNTLFIRRTLASDVVTVNGLLGSIDVTVGVSADSFDDDNVGRISVLRSTSDNGMTIDRILDTQTQVNVSNALTVRGTIGDDTVGISSDTDFIYVKVNDAVAAFSRTLVDRISVLTYDGNDRISIGDGVGGVNVNGGNDNDTIFGNTGDDRLYGGAGDDLIKGSAGNDRLLGEAGDDTIYGQAGNDLLDGGTGNDKLVAGIGNDLLYGDSGNDRLYGEAGVDTLDGGTGSNLLLQD